MTIRHILVVDDEPKLAFFLGKALESSNQECRVNVANSGEQALEIAAKSPVDLLITDLRMPGINGLELMRQIRKHNRAARLILMTAFGSADVEEAVLDLQVSRYLTKPFQLSDLLTATRQILNDMEVSEGGMLAVSEDQFEAMSKTMCELIQSTGLQCAVLADPLGQILITEGNPPNIEISTLVALFAGGFATIFEVARHLEDNTPISLRYYEGKRYEIYAMNIGTALLMLLIGVKSGRSRLGTVWHYSQHAVKELNQLVDTGQEQGQAIQSGIEGLEEGFGDSLMVELDNVLGDTEPEEPDSRPRPASDERLSFDEAMAQGLLGPDFEKG